MYELMQKITELSDDQFQDVLSWMILEEKTRRESQHLIEQNTLAVVEQVWADKPELKPTFTMGVQVTDAPGWKRPAGIYDAYPPRAVVCHAGGVWRSTMAGLNMSEPGVSAAQWEKVEPPPAAEQATESESSPTAEHSDSDEDEES